MHWGDHRMGAAVGAMALGAVMAGLPACSRERVVQGECKAVNGAEVCAWGRMAGARLVAFGATVPMAVATNAPAEMPMAWPPKADATIALPAEVKAASGFDNVTVFWEPHGHPPGPYLAPHFDFHFNTADVSRIDCADSAKPAQPPVAYELPDVAIPQLGTLIGLCVPGMGMHALESAELHSTALFKQTMIVGYYHKAPIFVEPMITRATLMERKTFSLGVPAVPGLGAGMRYPTQFQAVYDSAAQTYRFTFSGM